MQNDRREGNNKESSRAKGEAGKGGAATREALTYCQRRQAGTRKGNARGGGKGAAGAAGGLQGRETSTETKS
jgi:hypothetical protein